MAYDAATSQFVLVDDGTWTWDGSDWTEVSPGDPAQLTDSSNSDSAAFGVAYDATSNQLILALGDSAHPGDGEVLPFQTWTWTGSAWVELSPSASPSPRMGGALGYDPAVSGLVLFGGEVPAAGPLSFFQDTWEWNGSTWKELVVANSPPGRNDGAFGYDPATSQLVLFGGYGQVDGSNGVLADTWTFDGSDWTEQAPGTVPTSQPADSLAFDSATSQMLMYGDASGSSNDNSNTWLWSGSDWSDVTPAPSSPQLNANSPVAYDTATSQLVAVVNDFTFTWNGTQWAELGTGPGQLAPFGCGKMAYDAATSQLVFYDAGCEGGPYTWIWNGSSWDEQSPTTSPPAEADGAALAFDTATGQLVLVGDLRTGSGSADEETWVWNGSTWAEETPATSPPLGNAQGSLAYDPNSGALLMFGGSVGQGASSETWSWSGTDWDELSPTSSPPAEAGGALTYDPQLGELVLFGGYNVCQDVSCDLSNNETWGWNGSNWSEILTSQAPAWRWDDGLAWDPATSQMILLGGVFDDGTELPLLPSDTWLLGDATNATATITSVSPINAGVIVDWSPPAWTDSGFAVSGYLITASPGGKEVLEPGSQVSGGISGLVNGDSYTFTVTPETVFGSYPASAPSVPAVPLGAPWAPNGVTASCGDGTATVSWSPPLSQESAGSVTGYEISDNPSPSVDVSASTLSYTFTGLTNGGPPLEFSVEALSDFGPSLNNGSASCTPFSDLGAPSIQGVIPGRNDATVNWSPARTRGKPVTGYEVLGETGTTKLLGKTGPDATSLVISGLADGVGYDFVVRALDEDGLGPPSEASGAVVPDPPTFAPTFVAHSVGAGEVTLRWAAPPASGPGSIVGYEVRDSAGGFDIVGAKVTSATFARFREGTYSFTVAAHFAAGVGPPSKSLNVHVPVLAGAPRQLVAHPRSNAVGLTWNPPASTGGDPVLRYLVKVHGCAGGSAKCHPIVLRNTWASTGKDALLVSSLTRGHPYWFTVAAETAVGVGRPTSNVMARPL